MQNISKKIFQPHTLHLNPVPGRTVILSSLTLILLWMIAEIILRTIPFFSTPILTLGNNSNHTEFDIKINRLEALAKNNDVDCFLIGNSMIEAGVEPELFVAHIKGMENPLTCFNLGLSAAKVDLSARVAEYLFTIYHPRVIIFGTSLEDYSNNYNSAKFPDQWLLYKTGYFTWEGFMVDSSMVYRYLITAPKYWNKKSQTLYRENGQLILAGGFRSGPDKGKEVAQDAYINYKLTADNFSQLTKIARLKNNKTQVIVVEMPFPKAFYPKYIAGGEPEYNKRFIIPLSAFLKSQNIPFVRSLPEINTLVPNDGWYNSLHFNKKGADIFSQWLSDQVARLP